MSFVQHIAEKILFRSVTSTGLDTIPQRGPVVIVTYSGFHNWLDVPHRNVSARWVTKSSGDDVVFTSKMFLGSKACHPADAKEPLANVLEGGGCVWFTYDSLQACRELARLILSLECQKDARLGICLIFLHAATSDEDPIRKNLFCRFERIGSFNNELVDRFLKDGDSASITLAHHFWRSGQLNHDRAGDLETAIFAAHLEKLRTLKLGDGDHTKNAKPTLFKNIHSLQDFVVAEPETYQRIRRDANVIFQAFHLFQIKDRSLLVSMSSDTMKRRLTLAALKEALLVPLGLWGIINHYISFKISDWLEYWGIPHSNNPRKTQLMSLPLVYAVQTGLIARVFDWDTAVLYLLTLPLFALCGLHVVENRFRLRDYLKLVPLLDNKRTMRSELLRWRWDILEEIEKWLEENTSIPETEEDIKKTTGDDHLSPS